MLNITINFCEDRPVLWIQEQILQLCSGFSMENQDVVLFLKRF
jgi:hypothetical protein